MDLSLPLSRKATSVKLASSATLTEPMPTHRRATPPTRLSSILTTIIYLIRIPVASHLYIIIISQSGA